LTSSCNIVSYYFYDSKPKLGLEKDRTEKFLLCWKGIFLILFTFTPDFWRCHASIPIYCLLPIQNKCWSIYVVNKIVHITGISGLKSWLIEPIACVLGMVPKIYFSFYQSHCPVYYIVSNLCALKYIVQNVLKKFPSVRNPKSFPKTTLLFSFINSSNSSRYVIAVKFEADQINTYWIWKPHERFGLPTVQWLL